MDPNSLRPSIPPQVSQPPTIGRPSTPPPQSMEKGTPASALPPPSPRAAPRASPRAAAEPQSATIAYKDLTAAQKQQFGDEFSISGTGKAIYAADGKEVKYVAEIKVRDPINASRTTAILKCEMTEGQLKDCLKKVPGVDDKLADVRVEKLEKRLIQKKEIFLLLKDPVGKTDAIECTGTMYEIKVKGETVNHSKQQLRQMFKDAGISDTDAEKALQNLPEKKISPRSTSAAAPPSPSTPPSIATPPPKEKQSVIAAFGKGIIGFFGFNAPPKAAQKTAASALAAAVGPKTADRQAAAKPLLDPAEAKKKFDALESIAKTATSKNPGGVQALKEFLEGSKMDIAQFVNQQKEDVDTLRAMLNTPGVTQKQLDAQIDKVKSQEALIAKFFDLVDGVDRSLTPRDAELNNFLRKQPFCKIGDKECFFAAAKGNLSTNVKSLLLQSNQKLDAAAAQSAPSAESAAVQLEANRKLVEAFHTSKAQTAFKGTDFKKAAGTKPGDQPQVSSKTVAGVVVGVATLQNFDRKTEKNEDKWVAEALPVHDQIIPNIAVFDGHAGPETSTFYQENLHPLIKSKLNDMPRPLTDATIIHALDVAFLECNEKWRAEEVKMHQDGRLPDNKFPGTTASVVLMIDGDVWVANLGDSRVFAVNAKGEVIPLSVDAVASSEAFQAEVLKRHGTIVNGRVNGTHEVPTAGGDSDTLGMSPKPHITKKPLAELGSGAKLFIASDQLFEFNSSQTAGESAHEMKNAEESEIASTLVVKARTILISSENLEAFIDKMEASFLPDNASGTAVVKVLGLLHDGVDSADTFRKGVPLLRERIAKKFPQNPAFPGQVDDKLISTDLIKQNVSSITDQNYKTVFKNLFARCNDEVDFDRVVSETKEQIKAKFARDDTTCKMLLGALDSYVKDPTLKVLETIKEKFKSSRMSNWDDGTVVCFTVPS